MSGSNGTIAIAAPEATAVAPGAIPAVDHWSFRVETPFRDPAAIGELAGRPAAAVDEALGEAFTDPWGEAEAERLDDQWEADEQAFEEPETEGLDPTWHGSAREAQLLEDAPTSEHPLASVFALPRLAFDALARGAYATAIAVALGAGVRDVNSLTNLVFWFRHPELIGQKLRPDQRDLAREWLEVRARIVRPALAGDPATAAAPGGPSASLTPAPATGGSPGGRTGIPSSGLRWYGDPALETPDLLGFMRRVYDLHVARSKGGFVDTLPRGATEPIEQGSKKEARKDAARHARAMLDAARQDLAGQDPAGSVRIGVISGYRSADEQFDIWQGKGGQGKRGFPYYYQDTTGVRAATRDPHGERAAQLLADHIAGWVAAPGYSNHQDGTALDLGMGGPKGGLDKLRRARPGRPSWFWSWLTRNASRFGFKPYEKEPWHWIFDPALLPAEQQVGASEAWSSSEGWTLNEAAPSAVRAGSAEVPRVPLLAAHHGNPPDLLLAWNAMPSVPKQIDVVVHLHGYTRPGMKLSTDILPWTGLDLAPVDGAAGHGRTRPTLTVLPRGHDTGVAVHPNMNRYTFPALTTRDGLPRLIEVALREFSNRTSGPTPGVDRLILSAHSGGGAPLMQILGRHDPHEVHVFDALYQDADALAEWARRHIRADRAAVEAGGQPTGAMRVFFRPPTRPYSLKLLRALHRALDGAPAAVAVRYRVEASPLGHWQIPRQYGWRILADSATGVPEARRPTAGLLSSRPVHEAFDEAEAPLAAELPEDEALDMEGEGESRSPFLPEAGAEQEVAFLPELLEEGEDVEHEWEAAGEDELRDPSPGGGEDNTSLAYAGEAPWAPGETSDEAADELEFQELGADGVLNEVLAREAGILGDTSIRTGEADAHEALRWTEALQAEAEAEAYAPPMAGQVGMSLPAPNPGNERCKARWRAKVASLPGPVREALGTESGDLMWDQATEKVRRAIDLGFRDAGTLTNFSFFAQYAGQRGYCPIGRGEVEKARAWKSIEKEIEALLAQAALVPSQTGPIACVGPRENRSADAQPDVAPTGLTGRYETTLTRTSAPYGAMAINQAGQHLELSTSPFLPYGPARNRTASFFRCDLDKSGAFICVNRENAAERFFLRPTTSGVALSASADGPAFATASRIESRSTFFPEVIVSIGESVDPNPPPRGFIRTLLDNALRTRTTERVAPFLYLQEHYPLARHQEAWLREQFSSTKWNELVSKAVRVKGDLAADKAHRRGLQYDIEIFVVKTLNHPVHGVNPTDWTMAMFVVRQVLSSAGFEYAGRRQSYLDWLQTLSQLTKEPIAFDSVVGVRPLPLTLDAYEYEVSLDVVEAALFVGGGRGTITVRQTKPTPWPKAIELRVWFGSIGGSIKVGTDKFHGTATSPLPWTEGDFVGRIERIKAGVELAVPGLSVGLSAGFLLIYGSGLLPPLAVTEAGLDTSGVIGLEVDGRHWKISGFDVGIGPTGLIGSASAIDKLPVRDLTTVREETLYGVSSREERTAHFCFDSALLTPAARQALRVTAAAWRPFLTDLRSSLVITGYADKAGSDKYNQTLSERRAANTLKALHDVLGRDLAVGKVSTIGKGETEATAGGVVAGAKDRRVEVDLNGLTVLRMFTQ